MKLYFRSLLAFALYALLGLPSLEAGECQLIVSVDCHDLGEEERDVVESQAWVTLRRLGKPNWSERVTNGKASFTLPRTLTKIDLEIVFPKKGYRAVVTPKRFSFPNPFRDHEVAVAQVKFYVTRTEKADDGRLKILAGIMEKTSKDRALANTQAEQLIDRWRRSKMALISEPGVVRAILETHADQNEPSVMAQAGKLLVGLSSPLWTVLAQGAPRPQPPVGTRLANTGFDIPNFESLSGKEESLGFLGSDAAARDLLWLDLRKFAPLRSNWSVTAGFESRYIYHGLDVVGFNSYNPFDPKFGLFALVQGLIFGLTPPPPNLPTNVFLNLQKVRLPEVQFSSGVVYGNANWSLGSFTFGVGFVAALEKTYPASELINQSVKLIYGEKGLRLTTHRYSEIQLKVGYSRPFFGPWSFKVGHNLYLFPDATFRNGRYQGEAYLGVTADFKHRRNWQSRLALDGFAYYSDARLPVIGPGQETIFGVNHGPRYLNGGYLEAKAESVYTFYESAEFAASIAVGVTFGYNLGYATQARYRYENIGVTFLQGNPPIPIAIGFTVEPRHYEPNCLEIGATLPLRFGRSFYVSPRATYGFDLSRSEGTGNAFGRRSLPERESLRWGFSATSLF